MIIFVFFLRLLDLQMKLPTLSKQMVFQNIVAKKLAKRIYVIFELFLDHLEVFLWIPDFQKSRIALKLANKDQFQCMGYFPT